MSNVVKSGILKIDTTGQIVYGETRIKGIAIHPTNATWSVSLADKDGTVFFSASQTAANMLSLVETITVTGVTATITAATVYLYIK